MSPLLGIWGGCPGGGGGAGGGLSSLFFPGGLGSGNSLRTILPSASTGDSFTVIPGLEGQVTSPLSPAQGEAYDGRYGILRGDLPGRSPAGRFGDLRSLGMFGDPQDVEGDGFEDAWDSVTKIGGVCNQRRNKFFLPGKLSITTLSAPIPQPALPPLLQRALTLR